MGMFRKYNVLFITIVSFLYSHTWFGTETVDDAGASPQIRQRELVELGPALRNQHATLLHHRMEPRQCKQGLRPYHGLAPFHVVLIPGLVRPLQVALDSGRSLIGGLEAGLEQDWGELGVALCRQPQPELLVRLQTVQLLLQRWQPC